MIIEENPVVIFKDNLQRENGISAFMRIKNGEDYLKQTILSIINQVTEIICVFNNSNDNTEDILLELEKKYPKIIKVYKYIPEVYPPNSQKYIETNETSVHSLVYYYNFALSKTTKKYCIKIDDDEIFFPNSLNKIKSIIEKSKEAFSIGIRGINLFDFNNKLYINLENEFTMGLDTLFFKYNKNCRFTKTQLFEIFLSPYKIKEVKTVFYHTKMCKKDRGINNYLLNENEKSRYYYMSINVLNNIKLIDIDTYLKEKKLIHPNKLNFKYINNSNKKYDLNILNSIENDIINKLPPAKLPLSKLPPAKLQLSKLPLSKLPLSKLPLYKLQLSKLPPSKLPPSKLPKAKLPPVKLPPVKLRPTKIKPVKNINILLLKR
jgi:glycosyltransferase involved in cell wall biosynthesis